MAMGQSVAVAREMQALWSTGVFVGVTDRQLLERFAHAPAGEGEAAFGALVQRHGPMVLRVCRGLLADPNDADDAFQSTFLALVRGAGSIRDRDSLASWLYGAARRVALRARADGARRRQVERRGAERAEGLEEVDAPTLTEPAILEELDRLPPHYRAPIVLCYLEGSTHESAASQLGWPVGTVRGRLARARELLRARLTRRGVTVPAALIGTGLVVGELQAAVPAALVRAASQSARAILAERSAGLPAIAVAWTGSGLGSVAAVRGWRAAGLVILGAIGLGLAAIATRPFAAGASPARQIAPPADAGGDRQAIQGTWSKMDEIVYHVRGVAQPPKRYKLVWSISADTITTSDDEGHASQVYRYTLDPDASPRTIELESLNQGDTLHGIYKLEGDVLAVCFGRDRPKSFEEGPSQVLITLPREARTPTRLTPECPNAEGCYWIIEPRGSLPSSMANSGGISAVIKRDPAGALVVTLAAVSRIGGGGLERTYRPVAFDKQKTRFDLEPHEGGWSSTPFQKVGLALNEFRLDPARLPFDRVDGLGIEVVPAAVREAQEAAAAIVAAKRARDQGVEILPWPEVGKRFEFSLTASDGKLLRSADFRGKVVLIDCWATWCTPCMAKMPELRALYARHHPAGLEVVGVNFDHEGNRGNLAPMIERLGLTWPQVFVPEDRQALWERAAGIRSLPRLFLIDREGILRWDGAPDELPGALAKLLPGRAP